MKRLLPWITGAIAIILLIAINLGYRLLLDRVRDDLDDQISDRLVRLGGTLADQISVDDLRRASGDDFDLTAYLSLNETLSTFRVGNGLVDVTLLDTAGVDLLGDVEGTDSLAERIIGYLDQSTLQLAVAGLPASTETYRWDDNLYMSAYAPLRDPGDGSVYAVVRVEGDVQTFPVLESVEQWLTWASAATLVFAVLLAGLFVWYARQTRLWEQRLLRTEKLVGLGRLAAVVAHEIRNPLGIIKATAQRLKKVSPDKQTELLDYIPQEVDRLDDILNGYLRMAELKTQNLINVNIAEHLEKWVRHVERGRTDNRVPSQVHIEPAPDILADSGGMRQIVLNLMINAFDVTPAERPVTISVGPGRDGTMLRVIDQGPGIPHAERQKIFEPFYTTKTQGSGLGLFAVASLVERFHGRIQIFPRDDGESGTIFELWFPASSSVS